MSDICISYVERIPSDFFDEFELDVVHNSLELQIESRPEDGPFACVEWFLPTIVIAFIGKSYFGAFFKEMGKEHFHILKKSLSKLTQKTMERPRIEPVLMGSPGKIDKYNPYSLAFSIVVEADNNYSFKLMIEKYSDNKNYNDVVEKFLDFISEYHLLDINSDAHKEIERSGIPRGKVLVHLNSETNNIEWLDHIPSDVRNKLNVQQENGEG